MARTPAWVTQPAVDEGPGLRGNDEGPTPSQESIPSVLGVAGEPGDVEQFTRARE